MLLRLADPRHAVGEHSQAVVHPWALHVACFEAQQQAGLVETYINKLYATRQRSGR